MNHMTERMQHLAASQWGLVHRRQIESENSPRELLHELRSGRWVDRGAGVLASTSAPSTSQQAILDGVLGAGEVAVASHRTAAALWSAPGFRTEPIEVTRIRGHGSSTRSHVITHEPVLLLPDHLVELDGVPVVSPTLVCFQVAPQLRDERLGRLVDWFWSRGLVHWPGLSNALARLAKRGRPGIRAMRAVLGARGSDYLPPASNLESRMKELFQEWRFGTWHRQVDVGAAGWIGRVDFIHESHRLIVEVQSEIHHRAHSYQLDDAIRFDRLRSAGYVVVEAWEHDIWHRPSEVRASVSEALRHLRSARSNQKDSFP